MSHRGYVVIPEFLERLKEELQKAGVPYRVVLEPERFGDKVRPILVTDQVAPEGWTRFGRCRKCKGPTSLGGGGSVKWTCEACSPELPRSLEEWRERKLQNDHDGEFRWSEKEKAAKAEELDLPAWFVPPVLCRTVADVRRLLRSRMIPGVGPEREAIVDEALNEWRRKNEATL